MQPTTEVLIAWVVVCLAQALLLAWYWWKKACPRFIAVFRRDPTPVMRATQGLLYTLWGVAFLGGTAAIALFYSANGRRRWTFEFREGAAYPFAASESSTALLAIMFEVLELVAPLTEALEDDRLRVVFWMSLFIQLATIVARTVRPDSSILRLLMQVIGSLSHLNGAIAALVICKKMPSARRPIAWSGLVCAAALVASIVLACVSIKKIVADGRVWKDHLVAQSLLCVIVGLDAITRRVFSSTFLRLRNIPGHLRHGGNPSRVYPSLTTSLHYILPGSKYFTFLKESLQEEKRGIIALTLHTRCRVASAEVLQDCLRATCRGLQLVRIVGKKVEDIPQGGILKDSVRMEPVNCGDSV